MTRSRLWTRSVTTGSWFSRGDLPPCLTEASLAEPNYVASLSRRLVSRDHVRGPRVGHISTSVATWHRLSPTKSVFILKLIYGHSPGAQFIVLY